jgi:predicted AlkP superfamily phosphohydrolase/phosphomutase
VGTVGIEGEILVMRLYFLGLDGLAANIIFAPEHRGRWPNLERLSKSGIYGPCDCEKDYIFTGTSWTSIYTGQPAAVHGITDLWGRPLNGSKCFQTVCEPYIWDILNYNGLSCGVVTMPITYPARRINGYMVAGFPSPKLSVEGDIKIPDDFVVDHSQIIRETERLPGKGYSFHDQVSLEESLEMMKASELDKAKVVESLLAQKEVDALFVQYSCLDRVGHELNNYARRGQGYDPVWILRMYDWFDATLLPRLLEIEADCLVVVSDHGWRNLDEDEIRKQTEKPKVWGMHEQSGVFMLRGPDVPPDLLVRCRNIDVLPTIPDTLGLPPVNVTGRSVLIHQSELEEIEGHLVALGYLEG